jgi:putative addiction module component (TIGR02574 family)
MSNLQEEIGRLSTDEKFELLDVLWASLEAEAPPITDAQREELDQRVARYEMDPSNVVSWEQVKASLLRSSETPCRLAS